MTGIHRPTVLTLMQYKPRVLALALLGLCALVAFSGCSDSAGGGNAVEGAGGSGGGGGASAGSLRAIFGHTCDFIERCPSDNVALAYSSRAECVEILDFVLTCRIVREGDDDFETTTVEKVSIPVSAAQRASCISWLQSVECGSALTGEGSPCDFLGSAFGDNDGDSFDGARRGEICEREGCSPGLMCVDSAQSFDGETEYCRICLPPGGPGVPCASPHRPCEEGLSCNPTLGLCDYPLLEGEPCEDYDRQCGEGLFCEQDSFVCRPFLADGQPCVYDEFPQDYICVSRFCNRNRGTCDAGGGAGEACEDEADCRGGVECEAGACTPPRANGEPCAEAAECQNRECDAATQRCGLPDGSACRQREQCQSLNCDRFSDTCAPTKELGASCSGNEECGALVCNYLSHSSNTRICMTPCVESGECPAEHRCDGGGCKPLQDDGAGCDGDEDCISGWCSDAERCGVKPGIGDACASSFDCYPAGWCDGGTCAQKLRAGQACVGYESCLEPTVCLGGTCKRISLECVPAPVGKQCTFLQACEEGAYCDVLDEFTCRPQKDEGEDCIRSNECAGALICSRERTCVLPSDVGEPCDSIPCLPGLWCDFRGSPSACRQRVAPGEPCEDSDACGEDAYCDGTLCVSDNPELTCVLPEANQ